MERFIDCQDDMVKTSIDGCGFNIFSQVLEQVTPSVEKHRTLVRELQEENGKLRRDIALLQEKLGKQSQKHLQEISVLTDKINSLQFQFEEYKDKMGTHSSVLSH